MMAIDACKLPWAAVPQKGWYRCVPRQYANLPPRISRTRTRFNDGRLGVLYFAPSPRVAMFEARALLGSFFHTAVPAPGGTYVVVKYLIEIRGHVIVDAREARLPRIQTSIQEMTGDWLTYPRHQENAPTQDLACGVHALQGNPREPGDNIPAMGLVAPSARNPLVDNLILFADRLPDRSVRIDPEVVPRAVELRG